MVLHVLLSTSRLLMYLFPSMIVVPCMAQITHLQYPWHSLSGENPWTGVLRNTV